MKYISVFLVGITVSFGSLYAQNQGNDSILNRTVVVENQYNPEIMDAFKMNVLPDIEEPAVTKQHIDYATAVRPFSAWEFIPMDAYPISQEQARNARGYIRAMYGNLNNVDAKGSYLWDITQRDRLGIMASVYGRNGDISSFNPEEDWKSRFYRTDVVLDYSHRFQKVSLAVGGSWGSQVFNFMPGYETVSSTDPLSGKQHYTLTEGYLSVSSVKDALPVDFSIQTGFRGFNRKYLIPFNGGDDFERIIHTKGYVSGNFNETQKIAIGFEMNNLMYDDRLTDNTLLQLNPYYTLKNDRVYFKAGAHVDWQIANKSGFKVAPDVQFDYVFADKYAVYIHALGGTRLNDFRSLNRLSPYWVKENQAVTSYTPLDGQIGLKASPVAGLGMKLFGGYRIVKNEMFVLPMYDPDYSYSYAELLQAKAQTAYAGAAIDYGYKDYFDISLKGKYYNWTMDDGLDYLLLLKPQYVVDVSARAGIVKNLSIAANYRYEARNEINNEKADALNNLSLWLDYEVLNSLNVFVRFNNLLNKDYLAQNGYPVQGLNFMAGCSLRF
ncbi:MAG TPA: TonB-dependent receptor [Candidatus Phocaeicola gallistercoris]|nr:TonB-dependent receptor [Candidatus Phocaeicola gallistercoris]